ncbi:hypothetical protein CCUS01_06744 [Colletotrichum cuscutae]|uniref:Uncharacterized protein n=1 Tax=Colletotrichum cuscutae TaxID=1209917 RepID=A0AAI9V2G7_9PEZI|nr:hypothetical protein CCUS01_06744 [Colletotrichum cuscutae]
MQRRLKNHLIFCLFWFWLAAVLFYNRNFSKLHRSKGSGGHCLCYRRVWIGSPSVTFLSCQKSQSRGSLYLGL